MIEEAFPTEIEGDPQRLIQILTNLTKNAVKFSPKGQVTIYFAFDEINELLCVHVHDTGKGVCETELAEMFSLFGKLRRTADSNDDGNGMGLMVCQKLVKMNGGKI